MQLQAKAGPQELANSSTKQISTASSLPLLSFQLNSQTLNIVEAQASEDTSINVESLSEIEDLMDNENPDFSKSGVTVNMAESIRQSLCSTKFIRQGSPGRMTENIISFEKEDELLDDPPTLTRENSGEPQQTATEAQSFEANETLERNQAAEYVGKNVIATESAEKAEEQSVGIEKSVGGAERTASLAEKELKIDLSKNSIEVFSADAKASVEVASKTTLSETKALTAEAGLIDLLPEEPKGPRAVSESSDTMELTIVSSPEGTEEPAAEPESFALRETLLKSSFEVAKELRDNDVELLQQSETTLKVLGGKDGCSKEHEEINESTINETKGLTAEAEPSAPTEEPICERGSQSPGESLNQKSSSPISSNSRPCSVEAEKIDEVTREDTEAIAEILNSVTETVCDWLSQVEASATSSM